MAAPGAGASGGGHIEAVHRVYKVVIQMRLQAAIAPLEQAITDVQRQVNQLQEQIEQMGREQGVEKRV